MKELLAEAEQETDAMMFDQIGFALAIAMASKMMRTHELDEYPRLKKLVVDDQLPELNSSEYTKPARAKLALFDWAEREDLLGRVVSKLLRNG